MGVGWWGDVAGVWGMWGGPVCCSWDSQKDGGAVSVSFAFGLAFGQEWGVTLGNGGRLGWCCVWGKLQVFKFGRAVNNRTLIYKGLTVT